MNVSFSFIRIFFLLLCVLFLTTYTTNSFPGGFNLTNTVLGVFSGLLLGAGIMGAELFFKRFNLRSFNLAMLGLLFGYLLGVAVVLIFSTLIQVTKLPLNFETTAVLNTGIILFCTYLGMTMTARAADEFHLSIPFVKLKGSVQKKKDMIVDASVLLDSRVIDLASSGLLDEHLIMPRSTVKELQQQLDAGDENTKMKARRSLDVLKKLESMNSLGLRYSETDFAETKDQTAKLIQLARLVDANIITADMTRIQQSAIEGIRVININLLSNALKPLTHAGEYLNIKIQRYGKEPRQGVGYLEDGTMVVVNGGAEFIGDTIRAQVLSVKHTSSGRMIFCNATECNLGGSISSSMSLDDDVALGQPVEAAESAHKNYFAL